MNSEMDYDFEDEQDYILNDRDNLPEMIHLASLHVNQALELSQRIAEPGKRWSVYLNGLALAGFRQWLVMHTLTFSLDESACMVLEPTITDGTGAVCHLEAKGFRLCLVATEPNQTDSFLIPQTAINHPNFAAHFYLPITVFEEQSAVGFQGFLRHDTLREHCAQQALTQFKGNTYQLPSRWLEPDLDDLLLYLNCLDPTAIPLPQPLTYTLGQRIHQVLVQPVVNTAQWFQTEFQSQMEPISERLGWVVIPNQTFASAMRELSTSTAWQHTQIEALLDKLRQPLHQNLLPALRPSSVWVALRQLFKGNGLMSSVAPHHLGLLPHDHDYPHTSINQSLSVTSQLGAAYHCFSLNDIAFQLYAIVSLLESPDAEPEWSLLLILKHETNQLLPDGLTLEVRDLQNLQIVQRLQTSSAAECLFTEVIGSLSEQFLVTIALDNGVAITLPTLQFQPSVS